MSSGKKGSQFFSDVHFIVHIQKHVLITCFLGRVFRVVCKKLSESNALGGCYML